MVERNRRTRQNEAFWKNESDMKLQSALKQPQVQNSEFKLPSIEENLNRTEMIKHVSENSPLRETVSRLQRTCVSKKKLSDLKHCRRISSANLSISRTSNEGLPENVEEKTIESEMEKDLSNNVKLKFAPLVNESAEALQSNEISKNVCNSTVVIKESSQLRSENKFLENELFSNKTVMLAAPEAVFDKKISTSGLFQNTRFKKKCHRVGFNTSNRSKRTTSSNRVNCPLMNNDLCEGIEEKTKFDEDIPFDINLVKNNSLSTNNGDLPNILHKNSTERCPQSTSKVQSKLHQSGIQNANVKFLNESVANTTKRKVPKDSKNVPDKMMRMSKENCKAKLNSLRCLKKFTSPRTSISGCSSKDSAESGEQIDTGNFLRKSEPKDVDSAILMTVHIVKEEVCEKLQGSKLLENGIICDSKNTSSKEQSSENVFGATGMANYETGVQSDPSVASSEKTQPSCDVFQNTLLNKKYSSLMSDNLKRSKRIACAKKCISTPGKDVLDANSEVTTSDIKLKENSSVVLKSETCLDLAKNIEKMERGTVEKEVHSANCTTVLTANNGNENWQSSKLLESGSICDNKNTSSKEDSSENELMDKIGMTNYETSLRSVRNVASHEKTQLSSSVLQNTLSNKKYPVFPSNSLKRSKRIASAKKSISAFNEDVVNENLEATSHEIKPEESRSVVLKSDPQKNIGFSNTTCKSSASEERNTSKIEFRSSQADITSTQRKLKKAKSSHDETCLQYTEDLLSDTTLSISSFPQNSHVNEKCTTVVKSFKRSKRIATAKFNCVLNTISPAENLEQNLRKGENISLSVNLRSNSLLSKNCEVLSNVTLNENAAQGDISVGEYRMDRSEVQSVRNKLSDSAVSSPEATDLLNTQKHQAVLMTHGRLKKNHKAKLLSEKLSKSQSSIKKCYSAQNINGNFENLQQRTEGIFEENLPAHNNLKQLLSLRENTNELDSLDAQSQLDRVEIQSAKCKFCKNISSNYSTNFGNKGKTSSGNKAYPTCVLHQKICAHKNHLGVMSSLKRSKRIASVKKSISGNDNITENVEMCTVTTPTEGSVSTDILLTKDSMLNAKVGNEYRIYETICKKEISDRALRIIPQSNSLCSQEQNTINEQISIMTASSNEVSNCQNTPKYTTFRVNTRSNAGLINCYKTKPHARKINSHVVSTKKTTCKNVEEKSEVASSTQSISGNIHSSRVSFINVDNYKIRLKNIRGKRNKNELECGANDITNVQSKEEQMQSPENKLCSQGVFPLHSRKERIQEKEEFIPEKVLMKKSRFISKLHQKADVNNKYRAIKLISVKRSMRVGSTPKLISTHQHNSCKDFVGKAIVTLSEVDNYVKVKSHAKKHKLNENTGDLQGVKMYKSVSEGDKNKSNSYKTSSSKNTSVHLKNPIVKLNPLNCFERIPSITYVMCGNKNKTDDSDTQTRETESTNVSMNFQERHGPQLNEKVCNEREKNKEGHCENKQICKYEHSMNVQRGLNHSSFHNAECNHSLDQMTSSNNMTVCQSTSQKKRHVNSIQHLKARTSKKSQNDKLNQSKVCKEKDSFSELTHDQDLLNKNGVDVELKSTTKFSEVAVSTNIKTNISTKNKRSDHTLQEIHEEVAQSKEFKLEPSKVVSNKSRNQSIPNTLSGGKKKIEKVISNPLVISEDVERVTKELQTNIPCVDGANDSINTDNSNDFMPLTVAKQKFRKRRNRQVVNISDLTYLEPSSIRNCDDKSERYGGKIKIPMKDSSAKPSKKENFKPVDVGNKMTSLDSKMIRRHHLHSSVQIAVGATDPEPMTQAILMKYLSSVLKRTVTKRDVKKFQPRVKLKRLNCSDIHSLRLKRRKFMNEMCICAEHCAKGVSLDHQHSERPQEMTFGCIHQGGHFVKVLCQQTGTDEDQLNHILIRNEKAVIGKDEVLNSTFLDSYIETSNIKLQFPLLKSSTYASDWQSCDDHKPASEREACTDKTRDISSASTASISPADSQTKESRHYCLTEPFELNRGTQSFLIKGDSCENLSRVCFRESSTSPNNSNLSTVNTTMPVKQNIVQSSFDRKSVNRNTIITPKKMPPSKKQIFQSLPDFNFPPQIFLKPFFSNASDIVERKEVGHKDLKIQSRSVKELDLFVSMIPNLKGLKTYKDEAIQNLWEHSQTSDEIENIFNQGNLKAALGGQRETILTPCYCPPSVEEVKLWAKARFLHKQKTKESKKCKKEETKRLKSSSEKDVGKFVQMSANSSLFSSQGSSAEDFPKASNKYTYML
ncbi:Uncharacterized protein GBIM_12684 [Gryllus bimaculatus]|nr:Uncharacterized protein GBIM_12684 [Gryllus bimaculatus]